MKNFRISTIRISTIRVSTIRVSTILIPPLFVALTACGATTTASDPAPGPHVTDSIAEPTTDVTTQTAEPVAGLTTETRPVGTQPPALPPTKPPVTNPPPADPAPADPPAQTPPVKTPEGEPLPPHNPPTPPLEPLEPLEPPVKNPPTPHLPVPTFNSFSVSDAAPCDVTQPTPSITVSWDVSNATSVYVAIDNEFGPWEQDLDSSGSMEVPGASCDDAQIYYVVAQNSYGRTVMQATRTAI